MKKLLTLISIVVLSITAKAQTTTVVKQELDTAVINQIYSCYAFDNRTGLPIVAKNAKEKKEFVNDLILGYIKRISRECAGGKAAEKARKQAEDEINTKPIQKIE